MHRAVAAQRCSSAEMVLQSRRRAGRNGSSWRWSRAVRKFEAHQFVLSLHRLRAQLMKNRIMQTNELQVLLCEFGIALPEGHAALLKALPGAFLGTESRFAFDAHRQLGRAGATNRTTAGRHRTPGAKSRATGWTSANEGCLCTDLVDPWGAQHRGQDEGWEGVALAGFVAGASTVLVAVAAVANKLTRTIWAALARG